jgi:hypothetical protein
VRCQQHQRWNRDCRIAIQENDVDGKLAMLIMAGSLVGGAVLYACGAEQHGVMQPASGVTPRVTTAEAVKLISEARCTRIEQCGEVGIAVEGPSHARCVAQWRSGVAEELSACGQDVPERPLLACVAALHNSPCAKLATEQSSVPACEDLCSRS